ncbi:MAG: hypothetical protein MRERC_7c061 [Mycoplasmataceae bacterium RC_NB112A]|nr:MAG: hypothetical protein MRERC_8c060 [Mycoplasmataceae bacterium RC_NB112A]KLL01897.1 MAG: hypothetical protein MRERC_7c061 [Mycoplasmataceae bacterium RC_NB112A]
MLELLKHAKNLREENTQLKQQTEAQIQVPPK